MRLQALIRGDEEAHRRLEGISDRANDLVPAWDRLLPQLRREERVLFATRGHGTWPANSLRTVARKGRNTPMVDSGRLAAALMLPRAPGSVATRRKTSLLFGVNDRGPLYYSRFVGKRRPFMVSERAAGRMAADAVNDHLMRGD